MSAQLPWRVAWVTGASSGIGLGVARQLAGAGVKVAVSSRRPPEGLQHPNITFFPLDVTNEAAVAACVAEIEAALGPIDLAVLAAGRYEPFTAEALSAGWFTAINAANYLGVTHCISALAPRMISRGQGHLSWFASVAGYRGLPKAAYYGPTKAALINLAECLKLDLEPHGLGISVINPGFVETPMTAVNDFSMPFLMKPEAAAAATINGLAKGKFEVAYPAPFVLLLKLLRLLPYPLYFALARRTRQA
ncbi:MAG: SDR family NAD(P)-dependent oxidoreductase [Alphaproteobacteria bacterium]|nr:SDR family NAD(P)-dependent oxidoreductase [Alphaproteobacteria bacterium]